MKNEDRFAQIERRLDELHFLLLDPMEQLKRLERGDSSIDEAVRRATSNLYDLEYRIDNLHPPRLQLQLRLLKEKLANLQSAQTEFEKRLMKIEKSTKVEV